MTCGIKSRRVRRKQMPEGAEEIIGIYNGVTYITDLNSECICGAEKKKVKKFEPGHKEWCDVFFRQPRSSETKDLE